MKIIDVMGWDGMGVSRMLYYDFMDSCIYSFGIGVLGFAWDGIRHTFARSFVTRAFIFIVQYHGDCLLFATTRDLFRRSIIMPV